MESFDNFALYFKFKNQIEQETNSTADGYTLAQFLYGIYVFAYGYDFLYQQVNRLQTSQMIEISSFCHVAKNMKRMNVTYSLICAKGYIVNMSHWLNTFQWDIEC